MTDETPSAGNETTASPDHPIWSWPGLSDDQLREVLSDPESDEFGRYGARLLESTMEPETIRTFMDAETLAEHYDKIRSNINKQSDRSTLSFWDETVKILRKKYDVEPREEPSTKKKKTGTKRSESIGQRLKELREENDVTQGELAQRLGVRTSTISDMENGRTRLTYDRIHRTAEALGYNANIIFHEKNRPKSTDEVE